MKNAVKSIGALPDDASQLVKRILNEVVSEVRSRKQDEYTIDLSVEKNYLLRACPLFKSARSVYAFSVDQVSTFWTNEKNRHLIHEYLNSQPVDTRRIFVFSSPREANQYRRIIQENYNCYGDKGGVFICSLGSYQALMKKLFSGNEIRKRTAKDFAILVYNQGNDNSYVTAQFDGCELTVNALDLATDDRQYLSLLKVFEELDKINVTDIYTDGRNIKIKRWNPECLHNNDIWKEDLLGLFPEKIETCVYHMVYFKNIRHDKEGLLLEIKNDLVQQLEELGIEDIWFGKKGGNMPVKDSLFNGHLKVNFDFDYVLIVKFRNYNDLLKYYSSDLHSPIRKKLYRQMSDGLGILYNYFDKIELQEKDQSELFEQVIEEIVSKYMVRQDYVETVTIDSIISHPSYDFSYSMDDQIL
jgi:hypothetical protein